jgi:hypothetical protein
LTTYWGAQTDPDDKSRVTGWINSPVIIGGYPGLMDHMENALVRHPDPGKQATLDSLKRTLASYALSDGCIPGSLWPKDPILGAATAVQGGYRPVSHGVIHGQGEKPAAGSFDELNEYDILEILPE